MSPWGQGHSGTGHSGDLPHGATAGPPIRACAFGRETLWVAAGDGLYREQDGTLSLQAEPGPVSRICVDGDRLLCVLRGGLIAVGKG